MKCFERNTLNFAENFLALVQNFLAFAETSSLCSKLVSSDNPFPAPGQSGAFSWHFYYCRSGSASLRSMYNGLGFRAEE